MVKYILYTIIILVTLVTKLNAQELGSIKEESEWYKRGSVPNSYEMGLEKSTEFTTKNIFTIKSIENKIDGFGTYMNTIKSDLYLGKTVKMTAYVKNKNVKSWGGLWMRVDYYSVATLAFDNMQRRPIKGTTDWTKYEVVLFVPSEATSISYGVLLDDTGQIWFKDVVLEVVDDTVPETGLNKGRERKIIPFEKRAKAIGDEIKSITDNQKKALKAEIDTIDNDFAKGIISKEKAEELKLKKAEERAAMIDEKVTIEEGKLSQLVQDKVDGKFAEFEEKNVYKERTKVVLGINNDSIHKYGRELNLTGVKFYNGKDDKQIRQSKRTTSQMVFATGANNLITDGVVANSDFKYGKSRFYEWGLTLNSRIIPNHNLLHAKYGLSLMYNDLRPTDNRSFQVNGIQTDLVVSSVDLKDSRFRNVNLVVPLHLEFDFTKPTVINDKTYFKSHDSFRLGLGGYFGANLKSKQIIKYDLDGYKTVDKTRGDFNTNDFIYGLSTYVGYKATSLYLKYDLNPLFKDNAVKQNNVSLGLRFDFN
ncbi:MAG TPA: hypothetical protein VL859_07055 [Flavobacterium sp.]|nr:hypothetical protein [Flavobacterium sp.]